MKTGDRIFWWIIVMMLLISVLMLSMAKGQEMPDSTRVAGLEQQIKTLQIQYLQLETRFQRLQASRNEIALILSALNNQLSFEESKAIIKQVNSVLRAQGYNQLVRNVPEE